MKKQLKKKVTVASKQHVMVLFCKLNDAPVVTLNDAITV